MNKLEKLESKLFEIIYPQKIFRVAISSRDMIYLTPYHPIVIIGYEKRVAAVVTDPVVELYSILHSAKFLMYYSNYIEKFDSDFLDNEMA